MSRRSLLGAVIAALLLPLSAVPAGARPVPPQPVVHSRGVAWLTPIRVGQVVGVATVRRTYVATGAGRWQVAAAVPGFRTTVRPRTLVSTHSGQRVRLQLVFVRRTARLGAWSRGLVRFEGSSSLRARVALRPVGALVPTVDRLMGTSGDESFPVRGGVDRTVPVSVSGLVQPWTFFPVLTAGASHFRCLPAGPATRALRVDLSASDPTADLDLFVYAATNCDPGTRGLLVASSHRSRSTERVVMLRPDPGAYIVEVRADDTGTGNDVTGILQLIDVEAGAGWGDLAVSPNPVPLRAGRTSMLHLTWSGLPTEHFWFGLVQPAGAPAPMWVDLLT